MQLPEVKEQLQERLALGLNYGLQSIEEIIDRSSSFRSEIINFKSQFNDLNRIASQNILGYEQIEIGYNKIRLGILAIIDKLSQEDLIQKEELPQIRNNELQHRKQNFFELLKIHLANLEAVRVVLTTSYNDEYREDIRVGREAMAFIYKSSFQESLKYPRGKTFRDIKDFSADYFANVDTKLEVYMNTLAFILAYIHEDEVDQQFFTGVVRSVLSRNEIALIIYYALAGLEPSFRQRLLKAKLITPNDKKLLIEEEHLDLLLG